MSLNMNDYSQGGGADLGQAAPGTHPATLVGLINVGLQDGGTWKGEKKNPAVQVVCVFELHDDTVEIDGVVKPRIFSTSAAARSGERAKLTKIVQGLDPQGTCQGNLISLLGRPCLLSLKQGGDTQNPSTKFDQVMPPLQGMSFDSAQTELFFFDVDAPDMDVYGKHLHKWMQEKIKTGLNYRGSALEQQIVAYEAQQQSQSVQNAPQAQVAPPQAQVAAPATAGAVGVPNLAILPAQGIPGAPVLPQPGLPGAPAPGIQQAPVQSPQAQAPASSSAPASVPASANTLPPAPPGFVYDPATNSYKPIGG
jgi:hypothetical protein